MNCHPERRAERGVEGSAVRSQRFAVLASAYRRRSCTSTHPWNKIQSPPLPAFTPPEPTRVQLANGMVIFLQPDHELPLITATARIRGGSISEPPAKIGLTDIYGEVWRTGGTKTKTGDQMDDFLEARAAKIETDNQSDSTTIRSNCLKGDFDAVFALYLDLLHNPEFRDDKIELAKQQMYTGISRRNDEVDSIVHREMPSSPTARTILMRACPSTRRSPPSPAKIC